MQDNEISRIRFEDLSFQINKFDDITCQITCTDYLNQKEYYSQKIQLQSIKVETIQVALEKRIPQIKASIQFQNQENNSLKNPQQIELQQQDQKTIKNDDIYAAQQQNQKKLKQEEEEEKEQDQQKEENIMNISISVYYDFVPALKEEFQLVENKEVTQDDIIKNQLLQQGQTLINLQNQLQQLQTGDFQALRKPQTVFFHKKQQFSTQLQNIAQLALTKGKYEVQVSFFARQQSNLIYLKLEHKGKDVLQIPNGWYLDNCVPNSPCSVQFRAIIDVKSKQQETIKLSTINAQSYPWFMNGFVMTAVPIV